MPSPEAKRHHERFTVTVDGVAVAVRHQPARSAGHDHFEFSDPSGEGKPIPISRTGYRSHFVHGSFVEQAGGPEAFARAYCLAVLSGGDTKTDDDEEPATGRQASLFD